MARVTTLQTTTVIPKKLSIADYQRRLQIGKTIRTLREKRGMSVEQAAVAANVKFRTWERWENGKTAIPLELVANISRALATNVVPSLTPHLRAA